MNADWRSPNRSCAPRRARITGAFCMLVCLLSGVTFPLEAAAISCGFYCNSICTNDPRYPPDSFCVDRCESRCLQGRESLRPFGAIAVSSDAWGRSRNTQTQKDAENEALAACRKNSAEPRSCQIATSYQTCGAVALGKNRWFPSRSEQGLSKSDAEANALSACRNSPGNDACWIATSGCGDDRTPEEIAEDIANIVSVIGGILGIKPATTPQKNKPLEKTEQLLGRHEIERVYLGAFEAVPSTDAIRIRTHLKERKLNEAKFLTCVYGSTGVRFWYETVPISRQELLQVYQLHPLRWLGDVALRSCPKTLADAENVVR